MRQGYNTASKYMGSPMSTQVQEIALQGNNIAQDQTKFIL